MKEHALSTLFSGLLVTLLKALEIDMTGTAEHKTIFDEVVSGISSNVTPMKAQYVHPLHVERSHSEYSNDDRVVQAFSNSVMGYKAPETYLSTEKKVTVK